MEHYECSYCNREAVYVGGSNRDLDGTHWTDGDFYCEEHKCLAPGAVEDV